MDGFEQEIIDRLRAAAESGRKPEGLLFHGSCEEIEGPLKGGGYDGVLWTADSPVIAQQYIPASGSTVIIARPMDYEMQDKVRPTRGSWWNDLARRISGLECTDIEYDAYGQTKSWRVPEGWPNYEDCVRYIEETLGYSQEDHGGYEIKQALVDGIFVDKPSDWQIEGALYVTLSRGLRFKDMRRSEDGDLMDLEYHDLEGFKQAADEGYDGIIINDFAQVDGYGNVGHVSWGLLPAACQTVTWVRIPAVRRPLKGGHLTEDTVRWLAGRSQEPALAP